MRLPNGYGSVIDLGKKRRNRYAVRVTNEMIKNEENKYVQTFKYLGYFPSTKLAYGFLAQYNNGEPVKEHIALINQPTFKEVYEEWYEYKHNMNKKPSLSSTRSYVYGFNMCEDLHAKKFKNIKIDDLQDVVNKYKGMSKGTVGNVKTILFAIYEYAMKREIIEKDYSKLIDYEFSEERRIEHTNFKNEDIDILWSNLDIEYVNWILIMIYTGWRVTEFCELKIDNVHIEERYIIGGKKTAAGTNRIVPLHKKIIPLIEKMYDSKNELLVLNKNGSPVTYKTFLINWTETMGVLGLSHLPHDTRYTTATMLDNAEANKVCIKKIMGHATQDITDGVYIQKNLSDLLQAIDLIKV